MKGFYFFLWLLFTLLLTVSIIGMLLFVPNKWNSGENPSTWMLIGKILAQKL